MLEIQQLSTGYGPDDVIHDINLNVRPGEIVALIGANGAGKSTLLKSISGLLPIRSGNIVFNSRSIKTQSTKRRVHDGLVHVPEGRQVFAGLSIKENLWLGGNGHQALSPQESEERIQRMCERFPVLKTRLDLPAGNLSGGQQQILAIARGLMSNPKLLLLDEPSLGLSPILVSEIFTLISSLRQQGTSILLSEQNAKQTLAISDRAYVLESGKIVLEGSGVDLLNDPQVAQRYLGVGKQIESLNNDDSLSLSKRLSHILQDDS
jgi:branched-chain amino acid transport system ATP-binding protein